MTKNTDFSKSSNRKGASPLVRVAGKYGLVAGSLLVVGSLVLYYAGRHPLLINIFFDLRILVFLLFIFVAQREFRQDINSGILHFWQGLYIGLVVYLLAAFVASSLLWIFSSWIEPDFVRSFIHLSLENLKNNSEVIMESLGEEKYNAAIESLPSTTAGNLAFDYFLKSLPVGFILTIIISIILRRSM